MSDFRTKQIGRLVEYRYFREVKMVVVMENPKVMKSGFRKNWSKEREGGWDRYDVL